MRPEKTVEYPEHCLAGRARLVYRWIPDDARTGLDAGCAWGYATRFFAKKIACMHGVDANSSFVKIAKKRYPHIRFLISPVDRLPYNQGYFDVVILADVIEHVPDEKKALDEIFRVLRDEGVLILTTVNRGIFSFLDPFNCILVIKKKIPWLYRRLCKLSKTQKESAPGLEDWHRHYSKKDLIRLLDMSRFSKSYRIEKCFRSGLVMGVLVGYLEILVNLLFGRRFGQKIIIPFLFIEYTEYWYTFGAFSYNIAVKVRKVRR